MAAPSDHHHGRARFGAVALRLRRFPGQPLQYHVTITAVGLVTAASTSGSAAAADASAGDAVTVVCEDDEFFAAAVPAPFSLKRVVVYCPLEGLHLIACSAYLQEKRPITFTSASTLASSSASASGSGSAAVAAARLQLALSPAAVAVGLLGSRLLPPAARLSNCRVISEPSPPPGSIPPPCTPSFHLTVVSCSS